MRKISLWAKQHRFPAIVSLVLIKLSLALIAFYLGSSLLDLNIHIPFMVCIIALIVLIGAAWLYPSHKLTGLSKKQFYIRQKSCDFIVGACSFVMIGTLVNNNLPMPGSAIAFASNVVTKTTPTAEEILASLQYRDKSTLTKQEKRILRVEFKRQVKIYAIAKVTGNKKGAGKAILMILTIIAAIGLLSLLAGLACSLSCNGSDAAALVVGILGTAFIIWGCIVLINRISRGPKKKKEISSEPGK
jgi:uncharacterized membrane protein